MTGIAYAMGQGGAAAGGGAGGFGGRFTAPGLKAAGATLKTIVSRGGVSSVLEGRKTGFEEATTDFDSVLGDQDVDTVVIAWLTASNMLMPPIQ